MTLAIREVHGSETFHPYRLRQQEVPLGNMPASKTLSRLSSGFSIIELLVIIVVLGLAATAVTFRVGRASQAEQMAKDIDKLSQMLDAICRQARVGHNPLKLIYDLEKSKIRAQYLIQYGSDDQDQIEFDFGQGVLIEQVLRSPNDQVVKGSISLLIQPSGWLRSHAVVLRDSEGQTVLFWNPRRNRMEACQDTDHIPWGESTDG